MPQVYVQPYYLYQYVPMHAGNWTDIAVRTLNACSEVGNNTKGNGQVNRTNHRNVPRGTK